jgi:hypothetical protein
MGNQQNSSRNLPDSARNPLDSARTSFARVLACPVSVSWAKDAGGIVLVDERSGETRLLWGLECTVWSWLSLGYSYADLAGFLAEILPAPIEEAEARLSEILEGWLGAGWLEVESRPTQAESCGLEKEQAGGEPGRNGHL